MALRSWVEEAMVHLTYDPEAQEFLKYPPRWECDQDGIFREIERPVCAWRHRSLEALKEIPTWNVVLEVLEGDERLRVQIGNLVGTLHHARRIDTFTIGLHVLPRPGEKIDFDRRYLELDQFFGAEELEHVVLWSIPGLIGTHFPVVLEADVELGVMSDQELAYALDVEVVRTIFPRTRLLDPQPEHRTCLRYKYLLPKKIGESQHDETFRQIQDLQYHIEALRTRLEKSLALVLREPVVIAGRLDMSTVWSLSGGVAFQQYPPRRPGLARLPVHLNQEQKSDLVEIWKCIKNSEIQTENNGLALALRRLSYQANRERPEDELLDVMIAAEALYLSGGSSGKERGELGYRMALRAALWAQPGENRFSPREIFKLMKCAYDVRSIIAHGDKLKSRDIKILDMQVSLAELVFEVEGVVKSGCRRALVEIASNSTLWPPDWDGLALGQ